MRSSLIFFALLAAPPLLAQSVGSLKYKPTDDERPVVKQASLRPSGSNFALLLEFNRTPWGEECKKRCAIATFYIDTDDDVTTGLQAGEGKPQTGADLGVIVQGAKEFGAVSSASFLKVTVRQLDGADKRLNDGDLIAELDHRRDRERLEANGNEVHVLIDATMGTLPAAKDCRFVYAPSGAKPVIGRCRGLGGGGPTRNVQIQKGLRPVKPTKKRDAYPYGEGG